ncbi:M-phase phosphoprotein 6 [Oryzias melastigma]|uniref:M-phase phosphoprotein 6 n=1 Tax=Oryzias melastigma TaxID=30732 RepID=A0A834L041_ORYME|nr:M-phase phosphoprotein 6 [Oryzias melastigma]
MAVDGVKLSKNLLRMKFMQRGLDAETKKQLEEDERRIISDEHWYLDLPELCTKETLLVEEESFVPCEDLQFGRISFRGFNPAVEVRSGACACMCVHVRPGLTCLLPSQKLMALLNPKDEDEEEMDVSCMQTDVTDEEMALRYESLVGSMKKKFAKKRERAAMDQNDINHEMDSEKKRTFLKPQD